MTHCLVWGNNMNIRAMALSVAYILTSTTVAQAAFDRTPFIELTAPTGAFAIVALLQEHGAAAMQPESAAGMLCELDRVHRALDAIADIAYAQEQEFFDATEAGTPVHETICAYNDVACFLDDELLPSYRALLAAKVELKRFLGDDQNTELSMLVASLGRIDGSVRADVRTLPKQGAAALAAQLITLAKTGKTTVDKQQHA